jgi:aldehyde dehydrogenase (NAD+)
MVISKVYNKQYVAGVWRDGSSGKPYQNLNPYNNEIVTTFILGNKADVDEAYAAAKEAQKAWAQTPAETKKEVINRAADLLEQRLQEIAAIMAKETGSSIAKASIEIVNSVGVIRASAGYPDLMTQPTIAPSVIPGKENHIYNIPAGVIGVITPFNFPLVLAIRSVAPAIATGNAVVLKPDIQTAISGGLVIADIFEEAGLPKGVLNVLTVDVADIGDYFVEHPVPRIISFTGSTAVGRHVGEIAGRTLKRVSLELGGNAPFVVLEDADLERAISAALFGKFCHQGQICVITNRILVHRSLYDQFVASFAERAQHIPYGDPSADPSVFIGPIINEKQIQKILAIIEEGKKEARLVLEGKRIGNVLTPFVFADATNDSKLAQREIFGPVATIIPFDTEEEALAFANDTEYGLSAAVFTSDLERGIRFARRVESGMVHVNDQTVNDDPFAPFGGEKASGIGRFNGEWIFEEFTSRQWVSVQKEYRDFPF